LTTRNPIAAIEDPLFVMASSKGKGAVPKAQCQRQRAIREIEITSVISCFGDFCNCSECANKKCQFNCKDCVDAIDAEVTKKPAWYGTTMTTAKLAKQAFSAAIRSNDRNRRESAIVIFNKLTKNEHGKYGSHIVHLEKIGTSELVKLLDRKRWTKDTEMVVELAHLILLCSFKVDFKAVHKMYIAKHLAESYPDPPDSSVGPQPDEAQGRDSPIFLQFFYLFSIFFLNRF
jgi:hypothetical protein